MRTIYALSLILTLTFSVKSQTTWKMVSAGNLFSMGIKNDGTLWAWGNHPISMNFGGVPIQIGQDNSWATLSCGSEHVLLLKTDSTLWTMGDNQFGQLGIGNEMPVQYPALPVQVGNSASWIQINTGCYHSGAIQSDGTLWTWGYNGNGQLGIGGFQSVSLPSQVVGVGTCKSISFNSSHSLGLFDSGSGAKLFTWGDNTYGQLGDSTISHSTHPIQVFESTGSNFNWSVVAAGLLSSAAIRSDSTLWVFGSNGCGQLGSYAIGDQLVPVEMEPGSKWKDVKVGDLFCYGIKENLNVFCWGSNYFGVLGTGNTIVQNSPVLLSTLHIDINSFSLSKSHSFGFSFNGAHVLALDANHMTICAVGSNNYEQLGNGTTTSISQFSCGIADLSSLSTLEINTFQVYPNPASTELHIFIEDGSSTAILRDLSGRILANIPLTAGTNTIDIHTFSPGNYLVEINGAVANFVVE
jgi:alpha-tubulin suppressor-like RCC1 family protein